MSHIDSQFGECDGRLFYWSFAGHFWYHFNNHLGDKLWKQLDRQLRESVNDLK